MSQPRRIRRISRASAAYIAGLIDGEGTITLSRAHAGENRRLIVSIANTELCLLEHVRDVVGAGKITRKRIARLHHTPSYCYSVSSVQAIDLLRQLRLHLRSYKRKRADLSIERYRALTPRNGKYTPETLALRAVFEAELLSITASSERPAA